MRAVEGDTAVLVPAAAPWRAPARVIVATDAEGMTRRVVIDVLEGFVRPGMGVRSGLDSSAIVADVYR